MELSMANNDIRNYREIIPSILSVTQHAYENFLRVLSGKIDIVDFYRESDPMGSATLFMSVLAVIVTIMAPATGNYSQIDRYWSLLPALYSCHFAAYAHVTGVANERLFLAAACTVLWSARLTYNYARKGGYEWKSEDYRWPIIRNYIGIPAFQLLNFTFIGPIQSELLLAVACPAYMMYLHAKASPVREVLQPLDIATAAMMIGMLGFEIVADQQQWNFHKAKDAYKEKGKLIMGYTKEDMDVGFNTKGLWGRSRHPNFFAEQSFWVLFYLWGANVAQVPLNWTIIGAIQYLAVFQGSTWLTELISAGKYPAYKEYKKKVSRFIPLTKPKELKLKGA